MREASRMSKISLRVEKVRKKKFIIRFFLLFLFTIGSLNILRILGLQETQNMLISYGEINYSQFLGKGVNYNTIRMYHVSDEILHRDFSRFKNDGINVIGLSLYWYRLEGNTRGDYDGYYEDGTPYGKGFLEHVKRFIRIATQYNLKVLVTFHTLWGDGSSWCTPDYVIDPETGKNDGHAIVKSEDMKQAFLDMVNHTVRYLRDENVWAWAILNEPWGIKWKESFIDLIVKLSSLIKSIDGRPVTVRFVSMQKPWVGDDGKLYTRNHFTYMWNWDRRIFESLDFISFNIYINRELYDTWLNITEENIMGCFRLGKKVWVTEFGSDTDDDHIQAEDYRRTLEVLKNLPVNGWLAWVWNQFPLSALGKGWNLLKDAEGNPRLAYYELLMHDPKL